MAISMMRNVPTNSGTAPNAPLEAYWSLRMAICGSHWVPNRKSTGDTDWKKRQLSQTREPTMPTVVRMAVTAQARNRTAIHPSTRLRARKVGPMRG